MTIIFIFHMVDSGQCKAIVGEEALHITSCNRRIFASDIKVRNQKSGVDKMYGGRPIRYKIERLSQLNILLGFSSILNKQNIMVDINN